MISKLSFFLCLTNEGLFFFSKAPHGHHLHHMSNSNNDDEDIDIVGDDHHANNNNNNRDRSNLSLSSSDASRDLQLHVYGPPQFSEADILACMSQMEEEEEETRRQTDDFIKTEVASPDSRMKEEREENGEECDEERKENEDVEKLKEKLKQLEGSTKCSKCVVSFFFLNFQKRYWSETELF